ncbi:MAG: hypothetical protein EXR05_08810 [Acetobacteraceae bacterium]|nr:hypothetical protein [Acetobacteraceae bacterium]MSP29009.1 hypothetical protein [Acetobacteraceae bacterium]
MAGRIGCLVCAVGLFIAMAGGWTVIGSGDSRPPDVVHLSQDGHEIIISGRFVKGLERRFRKLLDAPPTPLWCGCSAPAAM